MCAIFEFSDFAQKMWKKIRFKFEKSEKFYKGFPRKKKNPTGNLCKFFPTFKLEIEFYSHKKVVSPKLENCAHLYIVNFF